MSPYQQITHNKVRTYIIFLLFIFIITGFFYLIGQFFESANSYLIFGLIFSLFSGLISYFFSDKIILFTVGAKSANKKEYFDLYTVTENLAIAAGLPMPKLYVINDSAPNAFATGRSPKNAVVCVTSGLLKILDRSDLEGVIAHELSHIRNYDILLASVVSVLVGTISLVSDWILRYRFWYGDGSDERRERSTLIYIFYILALIIAPLVATLIQLAISRRREFLADASAILLTRNKMGLIDALRKITQYPYPMKHATSSTAHLFISNPLKGARKSTSSWLANLFSTHPPVEERIKALMEM